MRRLAAVLLLAVSAGGCFEPAAQSSSGNPNIIVVSMTTGPNNLDPRIGTDDTSQKIHQLIYDDLMDIDETLHVIPGLAERLDQINPTTYVATIRRGVRFHDGHELTAADVVYTFRSFIDPDFFSPRKSPFRMLSSVDARDRYTVVFTLKQPFTPFPSSLVIPVVPDGAGDRLGDHPIGTGPYRFVSYASDDRVDLAAFPDYFRGRPKNDGVVLRIVPDEVMRGLELRKGAVDIVVNDVSPDIAFQFERNDKLSIVTSPGTDYQYMGLNLRDPVLKDVRVRQAITLAIDRQAIVDYLRRGLAIPGTGPLPPSSWAFASDVRDLPFDPARARALLDEAGYRDPDGEGPEPRLRLTLKVSNVEFNRLQSTVIQQDLRNVGIALDVRMYEFATLYADVLAGNFQTYTLQWSGGALADPDILRQIFHSSQFPPVGFNRVFFSDARVDELLDQASASSDESQRRMLYGLVQKRIAELQPYVSLWYKTNFAVAQRTVTGVHLSPTADLRFLRDVERIPQTASN